MVDQNSRFTRDFVRRLQDRSQPLWLYRNLDRDLPRYDAHANTDLNLLVSRSTPQSFQLGTGAFLYTQALLPAILGARREVIIVTCFWAQSKTSEALANTLQRLANHRRDVAAARGQRSLLLPLRVRICLSSRSFLQTLFHTASRDGYVYPPSSWSRTLGLPDSSVLTAGGIDLQVKSLFFRPFSVMHPKFVIVDRKRAFLPSCNISWEAWLEGCVEIRGDAVASLLSFYSRTWDGGAEQGGFLAQCAGEEAEDMHLGGDCGTSSPAQQIVRFPPATRPVATLMLPSSHHCNPNFRPFPWQTWPEAPATPLNTALLQLFEDARHTIYVQTPDVTSEPAMTALLAALARGVDVDIVTSCNIKPMEQILTAGTTTVWCIGTFVKRYRTLCDPVSRQKTRNRGAGSEMDDMLRDLEAQVPHPGNLRVSYFRARRASEREAAGLGAGEEEPVYTHVKLTIVDRRYTVLGSGNMDRASWFTSQELGILFEDEQFAESVKAAIDRAVDGRLDVAF